MTKLFEPREPQRKMISFGTSLDRCQLLAKPGVGKTASALSIVNTLSMTSDVFPVLVVAPLRVANSVWGSEVEQWSQFKGLRVSKVLGTQDQRVKALKANADIYTIHYGLLKWLEETLRGKWPFKTVICDESTKIAGHRCSYQKSKTGNVFLKVSGTRNAGALMRYARRTPYWMNLTGSFTTNGLQKAWGQCWPIDFGKALGSSYSAFEMRWFRQRYGTSNESRVMEATPWAFPEITERIKDFSISIDPKDYFDLKQPRVVDIKVQLPAKARAIYDEMRSAAVIELSKETTVTAVNAGAKMVKLLCIANGNVYDEAKITHNIHEAKLDALEDLVEELGGAPLVVCYQYVPDREAIIKRFPYAKVLPRGAKQKEVEDEWNAGKLPMLVLHPDSAGHGLSLQHGGCDIAFFGTGVNAELYEQVIERIGPMRQMQSGYDRVVSVYRLLAEKTLDRTAVEMVEGRIYAGNEVMDALRQG